MFRSPSIYGEKLYSCDSNVIASLPRYMKGCFGKMKILFYCLTFINCSSAIYQNKTIEIDQDDEENFENLAQLSVDVFCYVFKSGKCLTCKFLVNVLK